jgi:hypothetical protein
MNPCPLLLDDDLDGGDPLEVLRAEHPGASRRRTPTDLATALLFVRREDELDAVLHAVNGLLAARRAAGVVDVVVGAFVGPRRGLAAVEPFFVGDVIGAGHLVRASCAISDRWTLTWFDAPIPGAGGARARRRQLLAALWWDRSPMVRHVFAEATFLPVLTDDEGWRAGGADVLAELGARHPELRVGRSVLVADAQAGLQRPT